MVFVADRDEFLIVCSIRFAFACNSASLGMRVLFHVNYGVVTIGTQIQIIILSALLFLSSVLAVSTAALCTAFATPASTRLGVLHLVFEVILL